MSRKTLSLSNELSLMIDALGGVHRLTRHWIENYGMDLDDVPQSIGSLLVILRERLRLLDRVARGTLDPRLAWCRENDAEGSPGDPSEEDVRLVTWSDRKLVRHHRMEWKRAKRRRERHPTSRVTRGTSPAR
jgi:hypothetical protein